MIIVVKTSQRDLRRTSLKNRKKMCARNKVNCVPHADFFFFGGGGLVDVHTPICTPIITEISIFSAFDLCFRILAFVHVNQVVSYQVGQVIS